MRASVFVLGLKEEWVCARVFLDPLTGAPMPGRTAEEVLQDIREHPEKHRHDFDGLLRCSVINGTVDPRLMEAHEGMAGANGGSRCDVSRGPCGCGAWH